jgi:phage tail-like protein
MPTPDKLIDGPETVPTAQSPAAAPSMSGAQSQVDSTRETLSQSYLFYVKIDGAVVAIFTECSGIGAKRKVEPIREGGVNDYIHKLPGPLEHDNITLKRGVTNSKDLWNWFEAGKYDFNVPRRSISIIQAAHDAGVIKTWNLARAFPVSWKLSDLNSGSSALSIETLELAHEGLTLQS